MDRFDAWVLPSQIQPTGKIHAQEKNYCERFSSLKRQEDFLRSRSFFHQMIDTEFPLLKDEDGAPEWEDKTRRISLTHKFGHIALLCFPKEQHIGIDLEAFPYRGAASLNLMKEKIGFSEEWALLSSLSHEEAISLLFSLKESVYKAVFPVGRVFFYFKQAKLVQIDWTKKQAHMELLEPCGWPKVKDPTQVKIAASWRCLNIEGSDFILTTAHATGPYIDHASGL